MANVMTQQTARLDLAILLPHIDAGDGCTSFLTSTLAHTRGVEQAHIVHEGDKNLLCLHYDPNLVTLPSLQRLATEAGASVSERYHHEQIAFEGMTSADAAPNLEDLLSRLQGIVHATVNYAAGLIFVAYDSTLIQRPVIEQAIRQQGLRLGTAKPQTHEHNHDHGDDDHDHAGHNHGSAPAFLPHWMQERWTMILVAVAGIAFLIGAAGERFFGFSPTVALVFYIIAYIAGGYDIATHALPGLLKGKFDTDVLMLAAAAGAAILGEWSEGAFLLFLFSLGHAGEHYALDRARNAVSALGALMPKTARVKRGEQIAEVAVESLQLEDVVVVRPGDRIPVDGDILSGSASIDQSTVTGESVPVTKTVGDSVFAGTINQDAALDIKVTRLTADNTLSRVMKLVAEAQSQRSPTQQFTERFTARFVPIVLLATLAVIVVPPLLGWLTLQDSFYRGMLLLVASSPCALALGTPATILAGIAQAARNGVLIKGGMHLENLGGLHAIAFDKTGTITTGQFNLTDVLPTGGISETELLTVAAAVEQQSNHPLAQAVVRAAKAKGISDLPAAGGLENVAGRGVKSSLDGQAVIIGSLKMMQEAGTNPDPALVQQVEKLEQDGRTTMLIRRGEALLGIIALADTPREEAKAVMQRLRDFGLKHLIMLTGDNPQVANRIAREVGVTDVKAGLLPDQKLDAIKQLQMQYGDIAMIGDGVNDAPALATATVGIAMGGAGTAVALETADAALMGDDLAKLPFAIGLSRASRSIIRQNLAISLGVIGLLIVTSVLNIVPLSGAVILHEGSTLLVVGNAIRLLAYKDR